ncbi:unnamed protein product [Bursaphelenchus xylophilus]|uniref:Prolyl endopeptidase n=1 Tax=Bursaphelenchus xylophilus TaxID=6326 RepID=A0A1I7RU08_BURXY|nr:unnamed protein product [Bursaphelenchus xylophilus]CAG9132039.1 unnamed protein product [Bursaphelenchus xylophilus]
MIPRIRSLWCLQLILFNQALSLPSRSFQFSPGLTQAETLERNRNLLHEDREKIMAKVFDIKINVTEYPLARRDESVVEELHGVKIADPYRWMEDPDAPETQKFVEELNKISTPFLQGSNARGILKERLTKLWDYEKFGSQSKQGDYYYYYHNTGLQNQSVLYKQKSYKEKGEVFLDPNTWSEDGTVAIRQTAWSRCGSLLAIGISEKGSDWTTVKFRKNTGEELSDVIPGVKFSGIAWNKADGVFYSKYPSYKSAQDGVSVEKHEFHSLYYHKLGTNAQDDILVAEFRENPDNMVSGMVSFDNKFLVVSVSKGCDPTNQLYIYDLESIGHNVTKKLELKPVFTKWDAKYDFVHNEGNKVLIETNKDAPMSKLVRFDLADLEKGESAWQIVLAHDEKRKLSFVVPVAKDKLVVAYMEDACDSLYIHDLESGRQLEKFPLSLGSVGSLWGRITHDEIFFSYESFVEPAVIYRVDFSKPRSATEALELEVIHRTEVPGLDPKKFIAKQVFFSSKDGTKVPMFIVHPKNLTLNGENPVILNGYGGFNIAEQPAFSVSRCLFMEMFGAAIAVANIRGGDEYGETWHEAGMKANKQNVFDDFIAAAEYLIREKYTNNKKLAIQGGSNGGLLMGAVSQQRPDLFGAVVNRVGVLDMLRFHKFSIGSAWLPEYGNPEDPKDFEYIYKYSPLHNIRLPPGQQWPSTLVMTADHDDRVVPAHSLKYIAQLYYTLQKDYKDIQTNPVLARIDVKAGHGAGKPTGKVIDEIVDIYSFLQRVLKLDVN